MNYAKCATCHGLNSMGFCRYTACRFPSTESGAVNGSAYVKKTITNADRIRAMTDEELAAKIEELCQYAFMQISVYSKPFGKAEWLDWLKQEVTTNSTT